MTVTEADHQPYQAGPFRWRLGLRPLAADDWILIGPDHLDQLATKRDVLARFHSTALRHLDDATPECREVLDEVVSYLCRLWPEWFSVSVGVVRNHRTGEEFHLDGPLHPLEVAARLVQEDLVLLVERAGRLVVGAGAVCFPNRWDLPSKVGQTMAEVHAPVARLNEQLESPIDAVLDRLSPERGFWRLGWGLLDTDELYQATDGTAPPRPAMPSVEQAGQRVFLRVERETLRRLPRTRAVLFTIRTSIRPLSHLDGRPDDAGRLAEALLALPDDVAEYKAVTSLRPVAVPWLEDRARR